VATLGRKRIPELSGIEFTGHESVKAYAQELRNLCRDMSDEASMGAAELHAVLSRQKGHPLLMGVDVRLRSRRVCKRLERVSELMAGATVEAVKFYAEFRTQFAEAINPSPRPSRSRFDFNDDGAGDDKVVRRMAG
jgi:hypothetical protein